MRQATGIFLVLLSAAAFGTLAVLGRYAYAAGLDALSILFLRFTLAALVMGAWVCLKQRVALPRGGALARLVGMGALGYVGQAFSYLTALNYASAGLVALLLYLYPAFVALLSALVLKERLGRAKLAALGLAMVGTALTVGPAGGQWPGVLLAIAAAAIYSIYILVGEQALKQVSVGQSSTVIFASAGAMSGLLMLLNGPHLPTPPAGWAVIAAIVLVATVLPVATFLAGLERIGPTNAAMLSTLEPVVTVLLAAWLFGEAPAPIALAGGGLILAAVILLTNSEMRRTPAPDRAVHGQ